MSYIDDLNAAFDNHPDIADYRITLTDLRSLGIGIRDNDVGSVYSPVSFRQSTKGSFLVQWQDGTLSRGNLDASSLAIIVELLTNARQAAYDDPDAAQFLGPQQIHRVTLFADDVPPLFDRRTGYLLEVVARLQSLGQLYGATTVEGGVGAAMGQSWLRTSRGLELSTTGTRFSYSAEFDGLIGAGKTQCTLASLDEILAQIQLEGKYLQPLHTPVVGTTSGTYMVVLHPDVAYRLFSFYVWGNLGGSAIYHGRSPFTAADFRDRRRVFRPDLMVSVDPWEPLSTGSFMYSDEGVPTKPITYIDHGQLTQPVLDLKYARRLNLPPTTPTDNEESVFITAQTDITWEEFQPTLDAAILVLDVLGLHTQDRTSGNYSLSTSEALLIRQGEVQGSIKALLNGNLFSNLRDDALQLVRFPGKHSPGLVIPLTVTIDHSS